MANTIQTWAVFAGLAKETTWNTSVSPSTSDQFIPVTSPVFEEIIDPLMDDGMRNLPAKEFALNQGYRHAKFSFDFQPYPTPLGTVLMSMLGTDAVSGAGPYTHPFTVAGLPPSYSVWFYDGYGANARRVLGAYCEEVSFTAAQTGALKCKAVYVGKYAAPAAKPTPVYATDQPFLPWQNVHKINGSADTNLLAWTFTLKRKVDLQFGAGGTQDLTNATPDAPTVEGKLTFAPVDTTEYDLYRNNTQGQLQMLLTASTLSLNLNAQLAALLHSTKIDVASAFQKIDATFKGLYNATDGGPAKVTLINNRTGNF